jgi:hypothetical protein
LKSDIELSKTFRWHLTGGVGVDEHVWCGLGNGLRWSNRKSAACDIASNRIGSRAGVGAEV